MIYLTGSSNRQTRAARRADLGLLGTPAGSTVAQRGHYAAWAADNGCYGADLPAGRADLPDRTGARELSPTARAVRYSPTAEHVTRWARWLERLEPAGCLFATLPDVVGDAAATFELGSHWIARVAGWGHRPAWVMQDGLEADRYAWRSMLASSAPVVFIGGSTDWKLGAACADLVAEAKAAGKLVHMGRVNTRRRLEYAARIGCDTVDGTLCRFGPDVNTPKLLGWLDELAAPTPALFR